jgi:protein arginine N-methyltransferase 2
MALELPVSASIAISWVSAQLPTLDATFYDVYTQVAELHLQEVGLQTKWSDVEVGPNSQSRWGETREYFTVPIYRLPISSLDF